MLQFARTVCEPLMPLKPCGLQAPVGASQAELDALLNAVGSGRLCRVRASLQPHFSLADLMAAEARALLRGHVAAASLLLRHTLRLPVLVPGQCGSLPDLDEVSAATIRRRASTSRLRAAALACPMRSGARGC